MASVRLGYCYYFLPLLLFFYTFQHPSPDSTTNSDRPIYRLNGQPKIGILLLFFTLAISFSINEYYLLYDTPLLENNTVLVYVRNNVTYLLTYSNLYCIGDSNHIGEYEFQFEFHYGVHITSSKFLWTDRIRTERTYHRRYSQEVPKKLRRRHSLATKQNTYYQSN